MTEEELKIVRGINFCINCEMLPRLTKASIAKSTTVGELYVQARHDGINLNEFLKEFDEPTDETVWSSTTTFNGTPKWEL